MIVYCSSVLAVLTFERAPTLSLIIPRVVCCILVDWKCLDACENCMFLLCMGIQSGPKCKSVFDISLYVLKSIFDGTRRGEA